MASPASEDSLKKAIRQERPRPTKVRGHEVRSPHPDNTGDGRRSRCSLQLCSLKKGAIELRVELVGKA